MSILDIAKVLKDRMGEAGRRVPTRQLPDWLIRFGAAFDRAARQILPELGRNKQAVSDKAKAVLGWQPRSREDAILASGESMLRLGLLKSRK
jgi:dihydroflavonol-4-reductase